LSVSLDVLEGITTKEGRQVLPGEGLEFGFGSPSSVAAPTVRVLFNRDTGDYFIPRSDRERSRAVFKRRCYALDAYATEHGLVVYFLTLTLSDENVNCSRGELQRLLKFVLARVERATGKKCRYVWVLELQHKRWVNTGVRARHWHLAIAAPDGSLPHVRFVKYAHRHYQVVEKGTAVPVGNLVKGWGQGQVFCERATTGVYGYLAKYLSKDAGYRVFGPRARGFGSSQFGAAAWPLWTADTITRWCMDDQLEAPRRVRLAGRRLELIEPSGSSAQWCESAMISCPGGQSCLGCLADVYGGLPRWRVVALARSPWVLIRADEVELMVETKAQGGIVPAPLTSRSANADRVLINASATDGGMLGRGHLSGLVTEPGGSPGLNSC